MRDMLEITDKHRVYKNGAVFDMEKGRIVGHRQDLAEVDTRISKENTSEMLSKRLDNKRARIMAGANAVVAEGGKFDGNDLDFVEAIAEVQTIKALNPDDPKSTDAARFILQEAGYSEKQQQDTPQVQAAEAVNALASLVRAVADAIGQREQVIDITPSESSTDADEGGSGAGG